MKRNAIEDSSFIFLFWCVDTQIYNLKREREREIEKSRSWKENDTKIER